MQLSQEQKDKFSRYLEKQAGVLDKNVDFEIFSIDYLEMCTEDILLKMGEFESYMTLSDEDKENIETNLRLDFFDTIISDINNLAEQTDQKDIFKELGYEAETEEELMQILSGVITSVPGMSEFVVNSIINKYKNMCDEMLFGYNPKLIFSIVKEQ